MVKDKRLEMSVNWRRTFIWLALALLLLLLLIECLPLFTSVVKERFCLLQLTPAATSVNKAA